LDRRKIAAALVAAGLAGHAFFAPVSIAGMQIALAVAAAGLLLDWRRPARTPLDWPILAFVAAAVASDLLSRYGPPPLAFATLWRSAIGFFLVAQGLRIFADPERASLRLVYCACAGLAAAAAVGLVQYRTGVDVLYLLHLRSQQAWVEAPGVEGRFGAMGFFTSRLTFGHNAAVIVSLLAGALAAGAVPARRIWIVAGAGLLALGAIALTFDRGAYLGLCAAAVAIAAFAAPRVRKALAVTLAAAICAAALHPGVRARFATSFSSRSNADRVFLWTRAGEIIRDHPLLGVGFANYPRICDSYYDRVDANFPMRTWAHNLELSTLAEMGPLGLAALCWLLVAAALALVRRVRIRVPPLALGGLAAAAALFSVAQAHDVLYDTKVMFPFWFCLGLALSPAFERNVP
jgi:putative inorganic carbon (HCO3(-)) transporter